MECVLTQRNSKWSWPEEMTNKKHHECSKRQKNLHINDPLEIHLKALLQTNFNSQWGHKSYSMIIFILNQEHLSTLFNAPKISTYLAPIWNSTKFHIATLQFSISSLKICSMSALEHERMFIFWPTRKVI